MDLPFQWKPRPSTALDPLHTRIAWYILPWQKRFDRGLPGWDYGSCSVAAPDIDGRGCS
uniref:Uncharacterized protein n=1 Tax=Fagus sylvatica TaxID=28930 RepID=A0A2N9I5V8_FAGSY